MVAKQQAKTASAPSPGQTSTPPKQEVAKRGETKGQVASVDLNQLPAHMREYAGQGTEKLGREDLEIPRLKLISSVNPELQLYDDLRPGMFFHTASETIIDKTIKVVPIYVDKRYILWNPRDSGGGILARADDAVHWSPSNTEFTVKLDKRDGGATVKWKTADTVDKSGLANWGTMNPGDTQSQPAATEMYNYVFAFPDRPDLLPAVFTFQRGSIKAGRKLNTKLKTVRAPIFGIVLELSSDLDQNNQKQDYWIPVARAVGLLQDEKLFKDYAMLHQSFGEKGLAIKDIESAQDDGSAPSDDKDDPKAPKY